MKALTVLFSLLLTLASVFQCEGQETTIDSLSNRIPQGYTCILKLKDGSSLALKVTQIRIDTIRGEIIGKKEKSQVAVPINQVTEIRAVSMPKEKLKGNEQANSSPYHVSRSFYAGYNTFLVFYGGYQFPPNSLSKVIIEMGYQFAVSSNAQYHEINPWLTNNAYGLRASIGCQFDERGSDYILRGPAYLFFEYQSLQSNPFVYYSSSSSSAAYSEFTEKYRKYGLRAGSGKPIAGSPLYFMYSIGFYYLEVERDYSMKGFVHNRTPSQDIEHYYRPTLQLMIGLRVYIH